MPSSAAIAADSGGNAAPMLMMIPGFSSITPLRAMTFRRLILSGFTASETVSDFTGQFRPVSRRGITLPVVVGILRA
jgi:hypothetical protein